MNGPSASGRFIPQVRPAPCRSRRPYQKRGRSRRLALSLQEVQPEKEVSMVCDHSPTSGQNSERDFREPRQQQSLGVGEGIFECGVHRLFYEAALRLVNTPSCVARRLGWCPGIAPGRRMSSVRFLTHACRFLIEPCRKRKWLTFIQIIYNSYKLSHRQSGCPTLGG